MGDYILSNKAIDDLSTIWDYTFETWSETQADKYYYTLLNYCQDLADDKLTGKPYPEISNEILGLRKGQHIIFYRKLKNRIEAARILHSRIDLRNRLQE